MFSFLLPPSQRLMIALALSFACAGAGATLGRSPLTVSELGANSGASVLPSAQSMKSVNGSGASALYSSRALQLASGTVLTEYVDQSQTVFAVRWQGPVLPDLSQLLGDYFPTFKDEASRLRQAGQRGPVSVNATDLILVSSGRMGRFSGYAFVPSLLPVGVSVDDFLN